LKLKKTFKKKIRETQKDEVMNFIKQTLAEQMRVSVKEFLKRLQPCVVRSLRPLLRHWSR